MGCGQNTLAEGEVEGHEEVLGESSSGRSRGQSFFFDRFLTHPSGVDQVSRELSNSGGGCWIPEVCGWRLR